MLDASGKPLDLGVQAGEKLPQNYRLEVTNPGGHSSRPVPDNAIYHLADALVSIRATSSRSCSTTPRGTSSPAWPPSAAANRARR